MGTAASRIRPPYHGPAALVDVDGTLVDSVYLHAVAWAGALRSHGFDVPTSRIHRRIGMRGDRLLADLLGTHAAREIGGAVEKEHAVRFGALRDQVVPLPCAHRLLEELCDRGVAVVLTSSAEEEEIQRYLDLLDAGELVHGFTSAADVRRSKPDPEPIMRALECSGRATAIVVGDSTWDCRSARSAGIPAVAVLTGGFAATELRDAGAVAVRDDLEQVCNELEELLELAAAATPL